MGRRWEFAPTDHGSGDLSCEPLTYHALALGATAGGGDRCRFAGQQKLAGRWGGKNMRRTERRTHAVGSRQAIFLSPIFLPKKHLFRQGTRANEQRIAGSGRAPAALGERQQRRSNVRRGVAGDFKARQPQHATGLLRSGRFAA